MGVNSVGCGGIVGADMAADFILHTEGVTSDLGGGREVGSDSRGMGSDDCGMHAGGLGGDSGRADSNGSSDDGDGNDNDGDNDTVVSNTQIRKPLLCRSLSDISLRSTAPTALAIGVS